MNAVRLIILGLLFSPIFGGASLRISDTVPSSATKRCVAEFANATDASDSYRGLVVAGLKELRAKMAALPEVDNLAFQKVYAEGFAESAHHPEASHLDYKGLRVEISVGRKRYVVHLDSPYVQSMNNRAFLGNKSAVDTIIDMQNHVAVKHFGPDSPLRKELAHAQNEDESDAAFARASEAFLDDFHGKDNVGKIPRLAEYLEKEGVVVPKLVTIGWANSTDGFNHGDVAAADSAKLKRRLTEKSHGSYRAAKDDIANAYRTLIARADLLSADPAFAPLFKVSHSEKNIKTLDEGMYALLKKLNNPKDEPTLIEIIQKRHGTKLDGDQIKQLRDLIDALRPAPIYQTRKGKLNWKDEGSAFTGDITGGGAKNLAVLEALIRDRGVQVTGVADSAIQLSRLAEQKVTKDIIAQNDYFAKTVTDFLNAHRIKLPEKFAVDRSGDDLLSMLPSEVVNDPKLMMALAAKLNEKYPGRFRCTAVSENVAWTSNPVPANLKQAISGALENIHKEAMLNAEIGGVSYEDLKTTSVIPRAAIDAKGNVTISLFIATPNTGLVKAGIGPGQAVIDPRLIKAFETAAAEQTRAQAVDPAIKGWSLSPTDPAYFQIHPLSH